MKELGEVSADVLQLLFALFDAVCCSVLQYVAVCCGVLQMCRSSYLRCVDGCVDVLQFFFISIYTSS